MTRRVRHIKTVNYKFCVPTPAAKPRASIACYCGNASDASHHDLVTWLRKLTATRGIWQTCEYNSNLLHYYSPLRIVNLLNHTAICRLFVWDRLSLYFLFRTTHRLRIDIGKLGHEPDSYVHGTAHREQKGWSKELSRDRESSQEDGRPFIW